MPTICDFDNGKADNPDRPEDGSLLYLANVERGTLTKSQSKL